MHIFLLLFYCLKFLAWTPPPDEPQGFVLRLGQPNLPETGYGILPLPEGGYLLSGASGDRSFLQRFSAMDELLWHRRFDFNGNNDFIFRINLDSEGYVLGSGRDRADGGTIVFYFRYDPETNTFLWFRTGNTPEFSQIEQLIESPQDGQFFALGNLHPGIAGSDAWLMRVDRNSGAGLLQHGFHLNNTEVIRDGLIHQNALYTTGCVRHGPALDHIRASLTKWSLNGEHIWTRSYLELPLGSARTYGRSIQARGDTLIWSTSGPLNGADPNAGNACLIQTDLDGNLFWARVLEINDSDSEAGLNLHAFPDGYILIGTHQYTDFGSNLLVARLDRTGQLVWARSIGGTGSETATFGALIDDFVYIHGTTDSQSGQDALLVKLPMDGSVNGFGCDWVHPLTGSAKLLPNPTRNEVNPHIYQPNQPTFLSQHTGVETPFPASDSLCVPLFSEPLTEAADCDFSALVIPNVFSPNGDGINDQFRVLIPEKGLEQLRQLDIYNRWGQVVFSAQGSEVKWDGQVQGFPAPSDVYLYRVEVNCRDENHLFVGELSLIR